MNVIFEPGNCEPEIDNKCSKIDIDDFNELCSTYKACEKLGIFHLNIRSINKNFDTLAGYLDRIYFKFSIIVLTETWLFKADLDAYNLPGYRSYNEPSVGRRGGIRVFVAEKILVEQLNVAHESTFQSLNLMLNIPFYDRVVLSSLYKSPSTSNTHFNDDFESAYLNAFQPGQKLILVGDFNMDLFKLEDIQINRFYNFVQGLDCVPFITEATRDPPDSDSCSLIDNLFSNIVLPSDSFVLDVAITDHYPIIILFPIPNKNCDFITINFRDFSAQNTEIFLNDAPNLINSFNGVQLDDLHSTMDSFENWLTNILNKYFPIKQKQLTKKSAVAPWITKRVKECIAKKHRIFKLFKRGMVDRGYFNLIRNKVQKIIKLSKRNHYNALFDRAKNDIRKTWQVINKSLNRSKKSTINKLEIGDNVITDSKNICNELNNHFASIATNRGNSNPDLNNIPHYRESAVFLNSEPIELYNCIVNLKNNNNLSLPCRF